ncbi:MAG TPA: transporter associated domain-containing protein, partial [Candidatus Sulfotelmatobacter sp.]|nr:transporter associated domain-containing protein [Candidatus Sulfotelmatobacter sp.]
ELNSRFGLGIEESGDYDSIGGYVHATLGKVAVEGDAFTAGRARWTVEKVIGRRIESIRLTSEEPWSAEALGHGNTHESVVEEGTGHLS